MFKAKIIEDNAYYWVKRNQLLLIFLSTFGTGLVANFFSVPAWVIVPALLILGLVFYFMKKNELFEKAVTSNRVLEFSNQHLTIKGAAGEILEKFDLEAIDKIIVSEKYAMPQEKISDLVNEFNGKFQKNFIELNVNGEKYRFDFIIESYYMLEQLKKVINHWTENGVAVKGISNSRRAA